MPNIPTVRQDTLLTNISLQWGPTGHIADQVVPPVPVRLEDGSFIVYGKEKFNIPEAQRRPRSRYKEIDWTLGKDTYHAEEYGLEGRIDDRERNNQAAPLDIDETTTEIITDNILNNRERRVANLVTSTTNITQNTTLAGANQWSDATGGDPVGIAELAQTTIQAATGFVPNAVAMGYKVWQKLRNNAKIKAQLSSDESQQVTQARLADILGVERIFVGTVLFNTAKAGQTAVLGDMWGKDAVFFYLQPRPAMRRPGFAYQFRVQAMKTFRWRDVPVNCDVIRVNEIGAEKIIASQLGFLVKAAVA
jgi:hypothetical protein